MKNHLHFDFFGQTLRLNSQNDELLARLSKDFSYFLSEDFTKADFNIDVFFEAPPAGVIPSRVASRQSLQSLSFDIPPVRVNDYYGKLVSVYDYKNEKAKLWSTDIEKLHEVTYLLILSRVGKALDLQGLHKVHAMAFTKNDKCLVGMMPMKGGKSTLLANILRDQSVSIISDDCPLITRAGRVKPFPLRLGVDELSKEVGLKDQQIHSYTLRRDFYGEKKLISLEGLPHEIGIVGTKQILFVGRRGHNIKPEFKRISKFSMLKPVFVNMIVGVGLPMVMEYFWESGVRDFFKKSYIAISRTIAALALIMRSDCYEFLMSNKPEENAEFLLGKLD
tara:strand:- start:17137 stop:18141 length:1005 start_codon:yes stop_codon:yes gene_type:complete